MEKYLQLLLFGWITAFIFMSVLWFIGKTIKNYAIVDVGWGLSITLIALTYSFLGDGFYSHKILITTIVMLWGLRLSLFLYFTRIAKGHEDKRYVTFREEYGKNVDKKFYVNVFQLQGILGVFISIPFLVSSINPNTKVQLNEYFALALFIIAFAGESLADFQLNKFKLNPINKGKICDVGLWKYSRHPNYFFEWLIWVSFALAAISSPFGYTALISPIFMYIILTKVSGVKMTEEYSIKAKGKVYEDYQKRTNAFFPWFNKK